MDSLDISSCRKSRSDVFSFSFFLASLFLVFLSLLQYFVLLGRRKAGLVLWYGDAERKE